MNKIVSTICKGLSRTPPGISLPVGPIHFAAGMFEDAGRLIGFMSPIVRATMDKYTEDIAVSSQRIQNDLSPNLISNLGGVNPSKKCAKWVSCNPNAFAAKPSDIAINNR